MIASTFCASRPSLKFGTHSTIDRIYRIYHGKAGKLGAYRSSKANAVGQPAGLAGAAAEDDSAAFDGHRAMIPTEVVGNFTIVPDVHHHQVSLLARFERAHARGAAKGVGGVDGSGGNGFGRGHAQGRASQRKNKLQVK